MANAKVAVRRTNRAAAAPVSQFERVLANAQGIATVFVGFIVLLIVLKVGETILAPVLLALVVGLMFGPMADLFERRGVPSALSALLIVVLLLAVISAALLLFAVPLSDWVGKLPQLWGKLRGELALLKGATRFRRGAADADCRHFRRQQRFDSAGRG